MPIGLHQSSSVGVNLSWFLREGAVQHETTITCTSLRAPASSSLGGKASQARETIHVHVEVHASPLPVLICDQLTIGNCYSSKR